jgi:hypothetical protein
MLVLAVALAAPGAALGWGRGPCASQPTAIRIEQHLTGPEDGAVTFTYDVLRDGAIVATRSLTVEVGGSAATTVLGLRPASYVVVQTPDPTSGIAPADPVPAVVDPPACGPVVSFTASLGS